MPRNSNKTIQFSVLGRTPSKKNSRNLFVRGGKLFNIPSKRYKEWHKKSSLQIQDSKPKKPLKKVKEIELHFYAPDKRATDLTNKAESIMDLLVDNGFIKDDNWFVLDRVLLYMDDIDRKNPRCEVKIKI